jgi:hypothetical protein
MYRPSFQQTAFFVEEIGAYGEQHLNHIAGEADRSYRDLQQQRIHVRVGMEATGYAVSGRRAVPTFQFESREILTAKTIIRREGR